MLKAKKFCAEKWFSWYDCVIIYIIAAKISQPIRTTADLMKEIASGEGDLTQRLEVVTKDETGELAQSFNTFIETIHKIIVKIQEDSVELSKRTTDISKPGRKSL